MRARRLVLVVGSVSLTAASTSFIPPPKAVTSVTQDPRGHTMVTFDNGAAYDAGVFNTRGSVSFTTLGTTGVQAMPVGASYGLLSGSGTFASLIVRLPPNPQANDLVRIGGNVTVTTLTVQDASGNAVAVGFMPAFTQMSFAYLYGAWTPLILPAAAYTLTTAAITSALGYTPYDAANPAGYVTQNALAGMGFGSAAYQPAAAFDAAGAAAAEAARAEQVEENLYPANNPAGFITLAQVPTYTLPAADPNTLGGVKIGANLSISKDGTISVAAPYVLTSAGIAAALGYAPYSAANPSGFITQAAIDALKLGSAASQSTTAFDAAGLAAAEASRAESAEAGFYPASNPAGFITASQVPAYVLAPATSSALGGVRIGSNITLANDGTISVAAPYNLTSAAIASVLGFTPYSSANPAGYITQTAITALNLGSAASQASSAFDAAGLAAAETARAETVEAALYPANNPAGYITQAAITALGLGSAAYQPASAFDAAGLASAEATRAKTAEAGLYPASNPSGFITQSAITALNLQSAASQPSSAFDASGLAATEAARAKAAEANLYPASNPSGFITAAQVPAYSLAPASSSALGGVKIGANISVSGGVISVAAPYSLTSAAIAAALGFAPIAASGAPVLSVAGLTGAITVTQLQSGLGLASAAYQAATAFDAAGLAAAETARAKTAEALLYPTTNPSGFITTAQAPVQSVASLTGTITLAALQSALGLPYVLPVATSTTIGGVTSGLTYFNRTTTPISVSLAAISLVQAGFLPSVTVTVPGVSKGDFVLASYAATPPANLTISGVQATAANTVVVTPVATAALNIATQNISFNFTWMH